jgi:hypothetical protein
MWLDFRQVRTIFKKFSSAMGMLVVGGEEREGVSAGVGKNIPLASQNGKSGFILVEVGNREWANGTMVI